MFNLDSILFYFSKWLRLVGIFEFILFSYMFGYLFWVYSLDIRCKRSQKRLEEAKEWIQTLTPYVIAHGHKRKKMAKLHITLCFVLCYSATKHAITHSHFRKPSLCFVLRYSATNRAIAWHYFPSCNLGCAIAQPIVL